MSDKSGHQRRATIRRWLSGLASVVDIWPRRHYPAPPTSEDARRADSDALRGDWQAVANDLRAVTLQCHDHPHHYPRGLCPGTECRYPHCTKGCEWVVWRDDAPCTCGSPKEPAKQRWDAY